MEVPFFKKNKSVEYGNSFDHRIFQGPDPITDLIDVMHATKDTTAKEQIFEDIKSLVFKATPTREGIKTALRHKLFSVANLIWENGVFAKAYLKNMVFSLEAMEWAVERKIPFTLDALYEIIYVYYEENTQDRILYLFKNCNYRPDPSVWKKITCRGVAYFGFAFGFKCIELRDLVERTCDVGAMPICIMNGFHLDMKKCLANARSFEEVQMICAWSQLYTREVFVTLLNNDSLYVQYLKTILDGYLKDAETNADWVIETCEKNNLLTILCQDGNFDIVEILGQWLEQRKVKIDWANFIDIYVSDQIHNEPYCLSDLYGDWIDLYTRYDLITEKDAVILYKEIELQKNKEEEEEEEGEQELLDYSFIEVQLKWRAQSKVIRKQVLLCLCAGKYDNQSYLALVPKDLLVWILKRFVWI